ncbi:MAG: hypothetical protein RL702_70 [Pseudomonadota bacterium]|nr:hypothetical protein [Novosphingobium sp.]HOA50333.1 hypothetical protein [Novosphingobium sp.]HPB22394.1 hypothetical protein [Novosphingobium sp.]HPZ47239.1 hypothetical protein [Novosphingobium sp.]HQD98631.1 hypothetical protein [Novosphingobium sp.]
MKLRPSLLAALAGAALLGGCGDSAAPSAEKALAGPLQALDDTKVRELLSEEAQAALNILEQGARAELAAYKAEYGKLPATYAELASVDGARTVAVAAITDALVEQVPFLRRETLEQVAGQFVDRAQQRLLEQLKAQESAAPAPDQAR